jgi:hypothetical protein
MDKSDPLWMRAVLLMVPAVIAPLLAWLTTLRAASRRSSELDFLLRRIELVDRVQKAQGQTQTVNPEALDAELRDIVADLADLRTGAGMHPPGTIQNPHSGWRNWFLAYKQSSRKGKAYKALFYAFLTVALVGGIGILSSGWDKETSAPSHLEQIVIGSLGVGVYLVIGLAFRYAALREYHRNAQKRSNEIPATS